MRVARFCAVVQLCSLEGERVHGCGVSCCSGSGCYSSGGSLIVVSVVAVVAPAAVVFVPTLDSSLDLHVDESLQVQITL